jgi:hypothetical protein
VSNPNKAKGTRWEVAVAAFLRASGFPECFRMAPAGEFDAGDLAGAHPDFAYECRDRAKFDLAKNVRDAELRAVHKGCKWGVAIIKKRGANVREGYVVMSLEQFAEIMGQLPHQS